MIDSYLWILPWQSAVPGLSAKTPGNAGTRGLILEGWKDLWFVGMNIWICPETSRCDLLICFKHQRKIKKGGHNPGSFLGPWVRLHGGILFLFFLRMNTGMLIPMVGELKTTVGYLSAIKDCNWTSSTNNGVSIGQSSVNTGFCCQPCLMTLEGIVVDLKFSCFISTKFRTLTPSQCLQASHRSMRMENTHTPDTLLRSKSIIFASWNQWHLPEKNCRPPKMGKAFPAKVQKSDANHPVARSLRLPRLGPQWAGPKPGEVFGVPTVVERINTTVSLDFCP